MKRIYLAHGLVFLLGIAASLLVYNTAQRVADNNHLLYEEAIADLENLAGLRADIAEHERLALELYAAIDAETFGPLLLDQRARVEDKMPILADLGMDSLDLERIELHWQEITEQAYALIDNIDGRLTDWDGARTQLKIIGENRRMIDPVLDRLNDLLQGRRQLMEVQNNADLHFMTLLVAAYTVIIFAISFVIGGVLHRLSKANKRSLALAEFPARNPHPVFAVDKQGKIQYANHSAGWFAHMALGIHSTAEDLFPEQLVENLRRRNQDEDRGYFESCVGEFTLAYSWRWLKDQNLFHIYGEDITDKLKAEQRMKVMLFEDAVTGLSNRQGMMNHLQEKLDNQEMVYLLVFSVDRFHLLQVSVGFSLADEVIGRLGRGIHARTEEHFESEAMTARLESAVFAVAWTPRKGGSNDITPTQHIWAFRESLPSVVRTRRVAFHTAFNIGVGIADGSRKIDAETLLRDADSALQVAERAPRETIVICDESVREKQRDILLLEDKLREAISTGARGLEAYLQPKIDLQNGDVVGAELLLRWFDPELGTVPPERFIPIAEQSGLIIDLGKWVLARSLSIMSGWKDNPLFATLHLAVNVTATELQVDHYAATLIDSLESMNIASDLLELEITERILAAGDNLDCIDTLRRLRRAGVQVSIDDFGTGYSSLAYLNSMPVTHIKIDRQFVSSVLSPDQPELTSIIVKLAHELGLKCVAEGVETASQADFLRKQHCEFAQGYLFSKALSQAEFETFVADSQRGQNASKSRF